MWPQRWAGQSFDLLPTVSQWVSVKGLLTAFPEPLTQLKDPCSVLPSRLSVMRVTGTVLGLQVGHWVTRAAKARWETVASKRRR